MNWTFLARLILATTLAHSGLSKLGAQKGVVRAAENLGLTRRAASFVGRWLSTAEILIACMLALPGVAYGGAMAALSLLTAFTVLIGWNLAHGRRPACACFGEAPGSAISNWTLARNATLVAMAAFLVIQGAEASGVDLVHLLGQQFAVIGTDLALATIALLQFAVLMTIWARLPAATSAPASTTTPPIAPAAVGTPGWPPGTVAPAFDLPSLTGRRTSLHDLIARGNSVLILFTSPECSPCQALLPEVARWQREYSSALTVVLISRGSAVANSDKTAEFGITDLLLQGKEEIAKAYKSEGTPAAVVVGTDRRIASRVAAGATEIRRLAHAWAELSGRAAPLSVLSPPPPADESRIRVGEPAPPFRLNAVRGGEVDLSDFAGRLTVVLFWRGSCSHCAHFAPELLARELGQSPWSPQLIFLASGTPEENAALGFTSPVLHDDGSTMKAYGVLGTPSAVLIDAGGNTASAVEVGRTPIEELLRRADRMASAAEKLRA